ncbi:MAG: agmatinase [Thermoguttaceae bacterium]
MSTFFDLTEQESDPATARFHILPIPYEGTVCFMHGTAAGPDAILAVSDQIERLDEETLTEYYHAGITTYPAVPVAETPERMMWNIYENVKNYRLFESISTSLPLRKKFPIIIGGEHSITAPVVKAAAEIYPNLSVLQFDAHGDLRNSYTGGVYSHASVMRRVLEITPNLVQVGIRSFSAEEYAECPEQVKKFITPRMVEESLGNVIEEILTRLTENVYITFDLDAFDPAYAPGVGTPEPGGINWRQATGIIKEVIRYKNVVGADVVETAPLGGSNISTEFLAARLVGKIMAYVTHCDHGVC